MPPPKSKEPHKKCSPPISPCRTRLSRASSFTPKGSVCAIACQSPTIHPIVMLNLFQHLKPATKTKPHQAKECHPQKSIQCHVELVSTSKTLNKNVPLSPQRTSLSGSTRQSRSNKASLFNLDVRVKPEHDIPWNSPNTLSTRTPSVILKNVILGGAQRHPGIQVGLKNLYFHLDVRIKSEHDNSDSYF